MRSFYGVITCVLVFAARTIGQAPSVREIPKVPAALLQRAVTIAKGIGHAHDAVGTSSKSAQSMYDQGLAYLHSYVWIEAARAFNQALRDDASLGIAQAQLSLALTELNEPAEAHAALDRARALEAKASDHDRRHIEARRLQMAAEDHPSDAALAAYRSALDDDLKAFPNDAELW